MQTSAAPTAEGAQGPVRRTLLIIGGAEDRIGRSVVLKRFVKLAGGRRSRIVVIPTASGYADEVSDAYRDVFTRLRGGEISVVHPTTRREAGDPAMIAHLDAATGVFLTGGSQVKLAQNVVGTPVGNAILRAYDRGAVIAGTSAGASIMSRFMISLGEEGLTPRQRASQISAGLGLVEDVIIDQHFDQRGRYGRLMSMVAASPNLLGMGIDENTAAEIRDGRVMSVIGAGAIFLVDARNAITDAPDARRGAPLLVSGAVVHTLPTGSTFDLEHVELTDFVERHPDIAGAVVPATVRAARTTTAAR
ncbi:cyanophycinase [Intrasporangium oryzae NRRL B-24470]|uniref:Cyanophycinase n=1 Tax=Intrasporangium oryzae NRRL B-24470 TaxID=1386089 RepID=W9GD51_9MICO|nr:cyanophycinase [Intrasporangium oryzae]EWT01794.1 cyanophycinase [Intrasporangium oryzae NRRL B-24470]